MTQWEGREFCSILCANRSKKEKTEASERFWKFVTPMRKTACWNWSGTLDDKGYGTISDGRGKSPMKAHRISWQIHFGEIPEGLVVCHACDNPSCVNPNHLLIGTQMANMVDMGRKSRVHAASLLNLRPGKPGTVGAKKSTIKELQNGISK